MAHKKNTVDLTQVHDYGPPITLSFSLDVIIQVVIRSCLRVSSRIRSEGQNETALLSLFTCLCTKELLLIFNACRISLFIIYIREQILELPLKHFWLDPFYKVGGMGFKQIYMVDFAPQSSKTVILLTNAVVIST